MNINELFNLITMKNHIKPLLIFILIVIIIAISRYLLICCDPDLESAPFVLSTMMAILLDVIIFGTYFVIYLFFKPKKS